MPATSTSQLPDTSLVQLSVRVDDLLHKVGLLTAPYTQVPPAFLQKSAASHARSLAAVLKRWYQARQIDYRRYLQRHPPTNSLNLREEILAGAARHLTSLSSLNELRTHQYLPRQPALSKEELLQPWLALASAVDPAFPPEVRSLAKATQSKSTLSGLNLSDSTENELGTEMHRGMESAFGAAYDDAAVALGAGISYSIMPEEALKWLDAYTLHFKDVETKGLEAQAKLLVLEGVQAGEGASQIMDKLTSLFDSLKDFKAERVARTETSRMYAQGSLSAYKDLGYETVTRNEIIDGRTDRDLCEPFDGAVYYLESAMIGRAGDYPEAIPAHPSCLVSPGTPVYTADGWKAIFKVAVGDLVLTHRGRFRRVTKLHRQGVAVREVVELALLPFATIPEGESRRLVVTPEHPVLTSYGWKVAGEIVSGDKVRTLSVPCAGCGKPLPLMIEKGTKRYCSPQCQWKDPECRESTIRGIRKSLHQQYKDGVRVGSEITKAAHRKMHELALEGKHPFQLQDLTGERNPAKRPEVRKVISEGKRGARNPMHRSKHDDAYWKAVSERWQKHFAQHPEKHINSILAKRRWDGGMTWIETLMGRALEAAGISAEFSYRVGSRWLDWAIPEAQIDIECDGERWHSTKEQLAKDAARDLELQVQGWTVLRFPGVRIRKDAAGCVDAVGRLLANHAKCYSFGDFEVREVQRRTGKYATYNLAVEEDESYCAKIFVVHNCRGWWSGGGDESQAINLGQVGTPIVVEEPAPTVVLVAEDLRTLSVKDALRAGEQEFRQKMDVLAESSHMDAWSRHEAGQRAEILKDELTAFREVLAQKGKDLPMEEADFHVFRMSRQVEAHAKSERKLADAVLKELSSDSRAKISTKVLKGRMSDAEHAKATKVINRATAFVKRASSSEIDEAVRVALQKEIKRASYSKGEGVLFNPQLYDEGTVVHELGHMLENASPHLRERAQEFLAYRTEGEQAVLLPGTTSEWCRLDKFPSLYCGKGYASGATEILSMGMQLLHDAPLEFYRADPEYFQFIVQTVGGLL